MGSGTPLQMEQTKRSQDADQLYSIYSLYVRNVKRLKKKDDLIDTTT